MSLPIKCDPWGDTTWWWTPTWPIHALTTPAIKVSIDTVSYSYIQLYTVWQGRKTKSGQDNMKYVNMNMPFASAIVKQSAQCLLLRCFVKDYLSTSETQGPAKAKIAKRIIVGRRINVWGCHWCRGSPKVETHLWVCLPPSHLALCLTSWGSSACHSWSSQGWAACNEL